MPKLKDHCMESLILLGKPYAEVHKWLDEFAGSPKYGMKHRKVRHHEAGIIKAILLFGDEAGKAARQHVISDLKMEGWTESDPFPKDEAHYVKMGLF